MLVTIGSITTATRLARLIERNTGSAASVVNTPMSIKTGGCSYSVRFGDRIKDDVLRIMRQYNIPIRKIYRESYNGKKRVYYDIS